jgi:hypothetical protein
MVFIPVIKQIQPCGETWKSSIAKVRRFQFKRLRGGFNGKFPQFAGNPPKGASGQL